MAPLSPRFSYDCRTLLAMALFIAAYVALDWASFLHPLHGLNITSWNPAPALGVIFTLRWGWRVLPTLFVAILLAEWLVRGMPQYLVASVLAAVLLTLIYYGTGRLLGRRLGERALFRTREELGVWLAIVSGGVLAASICFVLLLCAVGMLPYADLWPAMLRYGVGDAVGVLLFMPLYTLLLDSAGRSTLLAAISGVGGITMVLGALLALGGVFWFGSENTFKYFYFLFLPLIWGSMRQGLAGAVVVATLLQLGIIVAVRLLGYGASSVLEIQMLALMLGLVGFFIGVVVDELRILNQELRHSMRMAAAGEMAGALAHELNQPLTALSAYGQACELLLQRGEYGLPLKDAFARLRAETTRTADVVRRLRDFFRSGETRLEKVDLHVLAESVEASLRERLQNGGVVCRIDVPDAATVLADRLQLELVLRNLIGNALDAVAGMPADIRAIEIVGETQAGRVILHVRDSGPGVGAMSGRVFEPFSTSKGSGLGLGLAISRAIIEAHGGTLVSLDGPHGDFCLNLPRWREKNADYPCNAGA